MKDTLLDIIQHTSALGFIDLIKVTGTDTPQISPQLQKIKLLLLAAHLKILTPNLSVYLVCLI